MKSMRSKSRQFLVARKVETEHGPPDNLEGYLCEDPYHTKRRSIIDLAKRGRFPEQRHILGDTQTFMRSFSKESTNSDSAKELIPRKNSEL